MEPEKSFIGCCFSFTVRRDKWGIPCMILFKRMIGSTEMEYEILTFWQWWWYQLNSGGQLLSGEGLFSSVLIRCILAYTGSTVFKLITKSSWCMKAFLSCLLIIGSPTVQILISRLAHLNLSDRMLSISTIKRTDVSVKYTQLSQSAAHQRIQKGNSIEVQIWH